MQVRAQIITRPALGKYSPDVLRPETRELGSLLEDDVRVRLIYLSLDPTNRNWLKLEESSTVIQKVGRNLAVGDVMLGQVLGVVEESRSPHFKPGDRVAALAEWQEQVVVPASRLRLLPDDGLPLTVHLSLLSHVGLAAMAGLREVARIKPGETVVVSGAAGATGSLAIGIAKATGCRTIGIAGGPAKCARVVDELGADGAIDYKAEDLDAALNRLCPNGVDAFFDNVGGRTLDTLLRHMSAGGRIAICGVMAEYDVGDANPGIRNMYHVLVKHLRIEGFLAGNYPDKVPLWLDELTSLYRAGKLKPRAHVVSGFEDAPRHLGMLFSGKNDGKLMVQVSPEP